MMPKLRASVKTGNVTMTIDMHDSRLSLSVVLTPSQARETAMILMRCADEVEDIIPEKPGHFSFKVQLDVQLFWIVGFVLLTLFIIGVIYLLVG